MAFVLCATHGVPYRHDEGSNNSHRSRLRSAKRNPNHIGGPHSNRRRQKSKSQSPQRDYTFIPDNCYNPNFASRFEEGFVQRQNPIYEDVSNNNNDSDRLDLNQLQIVNEKTSAGLPISAFPTSLIQWPVGGHSKTKRIAEVKKQVKLLGDLIKMTVGGGQHDDSMGGDKTPTNPAPFSSNIDMSRIPAHFLAHSANESSQPKWEDIKSQLQTGRVKEAKIIVREAEWSMGSPVREDIWRELCRYHSAEKDFGDFYYWDSVKQIYGTTELSECLVQLPTFVDTNHKVSHALSPKGISTCERIISVIAFSHPAITYAPSLYALTSLMLHYMDEADVYNCMSTLVSGAQNKFITQTKVSNEALWRAAMILARKHIRGSFSTLAKFGVDQEQIEVAFQNWLWWIIAFLPLSHMVRVIDCFLLEGSKVLLRIALAIFHLFVKAVTHDSSMAASLPSRGLYESIIRFCQNMQISPQKLLKTAFGIRGFSKSEITKIVIQTEMYLKSQKTVGGTGAMTVPETPGLTRSVSLEGLPTSESQANIQMMSHTLTIKELLTLWSWLPMRMTMHQPTLIYTSEEHGCSLTTFFQRVEKHEPTLLCIRTLNDHVFGAYCSTAWAQRNIKDEFGNRQTYFGTGETFLFSLRPTVAKYQWVGISRQQENVALSSVEHSSELFMHADNNMITIGGGNGQGIMLDQELRYGKTENCKTFDNPPLSPDGDFEVKVIEVFSLANM